MKFFLILAVISLVPLIEGERVMVISPHPDDGEIFCGGTILYCEYRGVNVVEVFVTSGGASSTTAKSMDPETLREEEALRVTQAFGVDETEFLHFPDGKIEVNETTETALKEIIKKYDPDIIYAPEFKDPFYRHSDHIAVGAMVDSIASNVRFYDYALKPGDSPVYVDVTEFLAEKNALLHGYESQRVIITQATKLLPIVYALNGFLAGKPLRYCEGFREKRSDNAEGCLGLSS
jgi:LmbE family N-acetylglucosaminyl deacetylase